MLRHERINESHRSDTDEYSRRLAEIGACSGILLVGIAEVTVDYDADQLAPQIEVPEEVVEKVLQEEAIDLRDIR